MARGWTAADLQHKGYVIDTQRGTAAPHQPTRHRHPGTPGKALVIDLAGTATSPPGTRRLTFANFRLESEKNRHEHWTRKAARTKEQRTTVYYNLRCTYWSLPRRPCTITVTRIAPRLLDGHDNLCMACSAVVDGISDWFAGAEGQGEDRLPGVEWRHEQHRGKPREYALWITIVEEIPHGQP